jgi:hypothetical protein
MACDDSSKFCADHNVARIDANAIHRFQSTLRRNLRSGEAFALQDARTSNAWRIVMFRSLFVIFIASATSLVHSQNHTASPETAQFDFLIGQWDLQVKPKVSSLVAMIHGAPQLTGTMKANRCLDGLGVEDELRVVDTSGNPISLTRSMKVFDGANKRWTIIGIDAYRARSSTSTAQWQDGQMRTEGQGTDADGTAILSRTRYFDITPDSYRMQQDRSHDDGKTWDEAVLVIDAKRTAKH